MGLYGFIRVMCWSLGIRVYGCIGLGLRVKVKVYRQLYLNPNRESLFTKPKLLNVDIRACEGFGNVLNSETL